MSTAETDSFTRQRERSSATAAKSPDSSHYFITSERAQKFDLLIHLLNNLQQPLLVCGPPGIGKTTMLRRIQQSAMATWTVCPLTATPESSYDSVLRHLEKALGGHAEEITESGVANALKDAAGRKQKIVLLLDDAGRLMAGVLNALYMLTRNCPALRPVLFIRPDDLYAKAASDTVAVDGCHEIDLAPLTEPQCETYLRQLALKPNSPVQLEQISPGLVHEVYQRSHGIPGAILELFKQEPREKPTAFSPMRLLLLGSMASLLVTLAVVFFLWQDDSLESKSSSGSTPESALNQRAPGSSDQQTAAIPIGASPARAKKQFIGQPSAGPGNSQPNSSAPSASEGPVSERLAAEPKRPSTGQPVAIAAPSPAAQDHPDPAMAGSAAGPGGQLPPITERASEQREAIPDSADSSAVDEETPADASEAARTNESTIAENRSADHPAATAAQALPARQADASETAPEQPPLPAGAQRAGAEPAQAINGAEWILAQDPSAYTLQLASFNQSATLVKVIAEHPNLGGSSATFRSRKGRKDLYPLLYGLYPDLDEARKAGEKLPVAFGKAWPRQMQSVQDEIRAVIDINPR